MTPELLTDASLLSLVVSLIVGYGVPFVKDLVLAIDAPDGVKSAVTTTLAALGGVVTTVAYEGNLGNYVVNILLALVVAVVPTYLGHSQVSQRLTGGKGLASRSDYTRAA